MHKNFRKNLISFIKLESVIVKTLKIAKKRNIYLKNVSILLLHYQNFFLH